MSTYLAELLGLSKIIKLPMATTGIPRHLGSGN